VVAAGNPHPLREYARSAKSWGILKSVENEHSGVKFKTDGSRQKPCIKKSAEMRAFLFSRSILDVWKYWRMIE
jgi:hypothetical protein